MHWVDAVDHKLQKAVAEVAVAVAVAMAMAGRARCRSWGDATAGRTTGGTASPWPASHTRLAWSGSIACVLQTEMHIHSDTVFTSVGHVNMLKSPRAK
jgi:hypothetical protein